MNLDDLRAVNVFLGIEPDATGKYDANWIHGTLIPALEERLGCAKYGIQHRKGQVIVVLDLPRKDSYDLGMDLIYGTGPTFEAAMISAAAKAVKAVRNAS